MSANDDEASLASFSNAQLQTIAEVVRQVLDRRAGQDGEAATRNGGGGGNPPPGKTT